jgi:hypothetical protein
MRASTRAFAVAFIASALGVSLAVVPSQFSPGQAYAAIAPAVPDPVSVLPSVVKGSATLAMRAPYQAALAAMLYSMRKSPEQWKAIGRVKEGVATRTEADLVAGMIRKFKTPATKTMGFLKGVGTAAVAVTALDFGFSIGNGALDVLGISRDSGTMCSPDGSSPLGDSWSSIVNGADCAGYQESTAEMLAQANSDMPSSISGLSACGTGADAGQCVSMTGLVYDSFYGYVWLFDRTGSPTGFYTWRAGESSVDDSYRASFWYGSGRDRCRDKIDGGDGNNCVFWDEDHPIDTYSMTADGPKTTVETSYPDPERTLRCEVTLSDGQVLSADSPTFTEGSGVIPGAVCPEFPPELDVSSVSIWEVGGGEQHELFNQQVTPEYEAARTTYPECMDGTCMLDLQTQGLSCFESPETCVDWYADPDKATSYTCRYGSHDVALSECAVYAPTFKPNAKATGKEYGDPTTGEPLPSPSPGTALGVGVADSSQPRECFPTGWGIFNPLEWVVRPVQCALEWAFVPRASVVADVAAQQSEAWSDTAPVKMARTVTAWAFVMPPPGGCSGITVDVFFLGPPFQIMNACPGSMLAELASWSRIFGNLAFSVYGVIAIVRHLSRVIGFEGLDSGGGSN